MHKIASASTGRMSTTGFGSMHGRAFVRYYVDTPQVVAVLSPGLGSNMNDSVPGQTYAAVLFDVYGTLFNISFINDACRRITDRPADLARLWRAKQVEYAILRSVLGSFVDFDHITRDALDYAIAALRLRADEEQRLTLMRSWQELPLYPDAGPALQQLSDAGYPLAILSNGRQESLQRLLANAGLTQTFDHVLSSEHAQTFKPSPAIYELAERSCGAERSRLLMVSSNGFDIAGAKSFGLSVCRINRTRMPADNVGLDPDFTIESFRDLFDLVTRER